MREIYGVVGRYWASLAGRRTAGAVVAAPRDRHRFLGAVDARGVHAGARGGDRQGAASGAASIASARSGPARVADDAAARADRLQSRRRHRVREPGGAGGAMSRRRVAVTGIGLMSALGSTREEVWRGMLDGRCGIGDVSLFDTTGYRSAKAAEMRPYPRDPRGVAAQPGAGCRAPIRPRSSRRARRSPIPDCSTAASTSRGPA